MKRIITFGLLVAAAFALTNCAQKESYTPVQDEVSNSVPFEIVAEIAADTKTYNDGMKTRWSKGDQLKMSYTFEIPYITTLSGEFEGPFTTVEGDGIFTGEIDGGLLEKVQSFFAKLGVFKLSLIPSRNPAINKTSTLNFSASSLTVPDTGASGVLKICS